VHCRLEEYLLLEAEAGGEVLKVLEFYEFE
jgi:hypothetical protein